VGNRELVAKIYFPRVVLPLASIVACLFDFSIGVITLTVLLTFFKLGVSIHLLWVPILFLCLLLLTIGLGLILSATNLFFRDVKYVVEIILMFGIFFTPVLYSVHSVGNWSTWLLLNPMGSILESLNSVVVLKQMPDLFWTGYAVLTSILIFVLGYIIFHKAEPAFAENI
jgi:ABC-type polysaccharide/polyol phosphate export permease